MKPFVHLLEIDRVKLFTRKKSEWYDCNKKTVPYIKEFLLENIQFLKINRTTIVNLNAVDECVFDEHSGVIVIDGCNYNITRYFLPRVISIFQSMKRTKNVNILNDGNDTKIQYASCLSEESCQVSLGSYLSANKNVEQLKCFDFSSIYYLTRDGSLTTVYFADGRTAYFYETLKYFESIIPTPEIFVRVRRDCIVNLRHVRFFKSGDKPKTGSVTIGTINISISRRLLIQLKERLRNVTFS